jgi:alcohol dehydrogenase class IV
VIVVNPKLASLAVTDHPIVPFEFATATRIIFGAGTARKTGALAREFGRRPLLITGRDARRAEFLLADLSEHQLSTVPFAISGEPDLATIEAGVQLAKAEHCDLVISIGGGSVLDSGKAIAALLSNDGELLDYLEVIGRGKSLAKPSSPFIAIPTTAGTGSEVTRNAVLASPEHRTKVSLRSPHMLPRVAIVDPQLTYPLPPPLTATTGLDALTQLIEPYVSCRANPMVEALCVEGINRAARSLRLAFNDGHNASAREDMSLASLFGGLALANAGLGAVHGFAGPIGGMFPAPHGAVCAALLPHVIAANLRALRMREPHHPALIRYRHISAILTGCSPVQPEASIEWASALVHDLKIPSLAAYGIGSNHIPELTDKAAKASSMKANPIVLTPDELSQLLANAL